MYICKSIFIQGLFEEIFLQLLLFYCESRCPVLLLIYNIYIDIIRKINQAIAISKSKDNLWDQYLTERSCIPKIQFSKLVNIVITRQRRNTFYPISGPWRRSFFEIRKPNATRTSRCQFHTGQTSQVVVTNGRMGVDRFCHKNIFFFQI